MSAAEPQTSTAPTAILADLEGRSRRFNTPCGDGTLVWRVWGSGPPVVLMHGSHGSWSHWIRNIDALAAERTVWAPDLPGYGDSALPPRADHAGITQAIGSGLRQLMPRELPLDIVGFSFGAVMAAHLAALHPDLVRRLVLVGAGGLHTPQGAVRLQRVRGLEGDARRAVNRANLLALMLHHPSSVDELALHLQASDGSRARLDPIPLVLPDKLLQALPHIRCQVDAIWAEHDRPHPQPAVQEQVLRRFHPDLEFQIIAEAGHWAMYERPIEFNRALLRLLRAPLRRGSPEDAVRPPLRAS